MALLIRGERQATKAEAHRREHPGSMLIEVSSGGELFSTAPAAQIRVRLADRAAGEAVERAVARALASDLSSPEAAPPARWVTLRTLRRADSADVEGALVAVRVTETNTTRLEAMVTTLERRGALGAQICWDGASPPKQKAEAPIFRLLEARRGKASMPVLLAPDDAPLEALTRLCRAGGAR